MWKAHRLMMFKRYAHARGQHALVYVANLKFSTARSHHTSAVVLQRRVRVFLALTRRRRTLADIARNAMLNGAAVKLQAFVRCHMVRRNYAAERTRGLAYAKMMVRLTYFVILDPMYLMILCLHYFYRQFWDGRAKTWRGRWSYITIKWIF